MVSMRSFAVEGDQTHDVLLRLKEKLALPQTDVDFLFIFFSCHHDPEKIRQFLRSFFPNAYCIGGTTHSSLITDQGIFTRNAIALLTITDSQGIYGAALTPMTEIFRDIGQRALRRALAQTDCPCELPALIWMQQTPGHEDLCLDGVTDMLSERCPVCGGVAADDNGQGNWHILTHQASTGKGIAMAILSPSEAIGTAIETTAIASGHRGILTMTAGNQLLEIDGASVREVFQDWTRTLPEISMPKGMRHPYGIRTGNHPQNPGYMLAFSHTAHMPPALITMSSPPVGERIQLMTTPGHHLANRVQQICNFARIQLPEGSRPAGAILLCNATVLSSCPDACSQISASAHTVFHDAPFLTTFTYGEIGSQGGHNHHNNLMFSATAFAA